MANAIVVDGLSKRYEIGELQASYGTLRDSVVKLLKGGVHRHGHHDDARLGARRRLLRARRGRGARSHRPERGGQVDAPARAHADHCADEGDGADPRPHGQPARGRDGVPSRADGTRERLLERRHPRHATPRDHREVRRHRRLLRHGSLRRHARQAVLERHVRAPRVRGRGVPRAGDPARRRGARRRRRRVPAALPRPHGGHGRVRSYGRLRLPQHADDRAALRPRDPARRRPRDRGRGQRRRGGRIPAVGSRLEAPRGRGRTTTRRPATTSRGFASRA